jgi:hypothetical protein
MARGELDKMTLYEIDEKIIEVCGNIDENGELLDYDALAEFVDKKNEKVEGLALYYKNLVADASTIREEEKALATRRRAKESKAENIKMFLERYLGVKFETARVQISYRKSEMVEILNERDISKDYLVYSEPRIDKDEIKRAIKRGEEVNGAMLVEHNNIQIK